MKIQFRDISIIAAAEKYGGTIQNFADLFFNGNYKMASKRLIKLEKTKLIKGSLHPILNLKVYYKGKMPSYHSLIAQEIYIKNVSVIDSFKTEVKLSNYKVDVLIITKDLKVYVIEIDIFNRTSEKKLQDIKTFIKTKLGKEPNIIVLRKRDIDNKQIPVLT